MSIRWVHRPADPRPEPRVFLARVLARQDRPRSEPGTRASYSNVGYLALGEVIVTAAGRPYEAFVREELLQPLRMSRTARLAALHCGGSASQTRVLSSQSIAAMAAISTRGKPYDLGLGWGRPRPARRALRRRHGLLEPHARKPADNPRRRRHEQHHTALGHHRVRGRRHGGSLPWQPPR